MTSKEVCLSSKSYTVAIILIARKTKRTYSLNKKNQRCESTQPLHKFLPDLNQLIWYKKEDGKVDYFA